MIERWAAAPALLARGQPDRPPADGTRVDETGSVGVWPRGVMAVHPPVLVRLLRALLLVALAGYVGWLLRGPAGFLPGRDGWLYDGVLVASTALAGARAVHRGPDRLAWALLASGLALWTAGDLVWVLWAGRLDPQPFPSICDALWLSVYPCAYAALVLLVRSRVRRFHASMWLDGLLAAFGAAAFGALAVTVVADTNTGGRAALIVNLAYPIADLLLLALLLGLLALLGWRPDRMWSCLAAGSLVFALVDTGYLLALAADSYTKGTLLDAGWPAAVVLLALAGWQPSRTGRRHLHGGAILVVPGLITASTLGLLVFATRRPVPLAAVVFAACAMLAVAVRTALTFREVQALAESRRQARTDELTGLVNRRGLYDALDRLLAAPSTDPLAVLLIDLDRFKEVNDSLGHAAGDELLVQVAGRVRQALRTDDVLVRLGGDEFALALPDVEAAAALTVTEHVRTALIAPFTVSDVPVHVDASIGVAVFPAHGRDRQELLRCADVAMYAAKTGRTGVELYRPTSDGGGRARLELAAALRATVAGDASGGELVLHYQPQVDLDTHRVRAVEALVRWQHPTRGLLFPDTFLPLVEQAGLIRPLTAVVLDLALAQARTWRETGRELAVAVNLSASNLVDLTLPDQISLRLREHRLPPSALILEITESVLLSDRTRSLDVLHALRAPGVQLSVDDYGTGYSSLSYLRELPISELKLDKSFVVHMDSDPRAAAIVIHDRARARARPPARRRGRRDTHHPHRPRRRRVRPGPGLLPVPPAGAGAAAPLAGRPPAGRSAAGQRCSVEAFDHLPRRRCPQKLIAEGQFHPER